MVIKLTKYIYCTIVFLFVLSCSKKEETDLVKWKQSRIIDFKEDNSVPTEDFPPYSVDFLVEFTNSTSEEKSIEIKNSVESTSFYLVFEVGDSHDSLKLKAHRNVNFILKEGSTVKVPLSFFGPNQKTNESKKEYLKRMENLMNREGSIVFVSNKNENFIAKKTKDYEIVFINDDNREKLDDWLD